MKLLLDILIFSLCVQLVCMQQCHEVTRRVTVCDDDEDMMVAKGARREKGSQGNPGKKGAKGEAGAKGNVGEKGIQGESCALGSFESEMRHRLKELEKLATSPKYVSCLASSIYGRQILISGEEAFCDGGWTVFQRRMDGSVNFQKDWNAYKTKFGDFSGEFWLGLDKIHSLTKNRGCKLRVDLWDFDDDHAFAQYSSFSVEDERDMYRLHINGYHGTAGDSMSPDDSATNDNMQFTTLNRDNDQWTNNCATDHAGDLGGWWFNACGSSRLNAVWGRSQGNWRNIVWNHWKGIAVALKATTMKLRCD